MQVTERILGKRRMPWEGDGHAAQTLRRRLGRFPAPVLELLQRNPSERMSVTEFQMRCQRAMPQVAQRAAQHVPPQGPRSGGKGRRGLHSAR